MPTSKGPMDLTGTEAGRKLGVSTHTPARTVTNIVSPLAKTEERMEAGTSAFDLCAQERQDLGIQPDEGLKWVRNPAEWGRVEKSSRVDQALKEHRGRRVPLVDGEFVTQGDLVLMVKSREEMQQERERDAAAISEFDQQMDPDSDGIPNARRWKGGNITPGQRRAQHDQHTASGAIGPTGGRQTFMEVERRYGAEEVAAEEARWRANGRVRHVPESGTPDRQKYEEARERAESGAKGKRSFTMGAGLRNGRVERA